MLKIILSNKNFLEKKLSSHVKNNLESLKLVPTKSGRSQNSQIKKPILKSNYNTLVVTRDK